MEYHTKYEPNATQLQAIYEHISNLRQLGRLTIDQANVEMVKAERFRLITSRMPREVRSALNNAVKAGELGHMKKDGLMPEAYYSTSDPYWKDLTVAARKEYARESVRRISGVLQSTTITEIIEREA